MESQENVTLIQNLPVALSMVFVVKQVNIVHAANALITPKQKKKRLRQNYQNQAEMLVLVSFSKKMMKRPM